MTKPRHNAKQLGLTGLGALVVSLVCLWLLAAAPASAAPFQQVGCFAGTLPGPTESCKTVSEEKFGEEVQLGGIGGMAVNYTGEGGVPPGTVYAVGSERVAMFVPKTFPDGDGLEFRLAWTVTLQEEPYERCGPGLGETPEGKAEQPCTPQVSAGPAGKDVDVDQTTGNVYVHNGAINAGLKAIVVYDPEGTKVLSRFGEVAPGDKSIAETPDLVHAEIGNVLPGGLAVNGAGEVYLFDNSVLGVFYQRLMVFEPTTPGEFDEYEYAGEVLAGKEGTLPTGPVTDAAGNLYVGGAGVGGDDLERYAPPTPAPYPAPAATATCKFKFGPGGITAATVDPESKEVFFFSSKIPKRIHRVGSSCDPETGEFSETEAIAVAPPRDDLWGLAFDPERELPARGPGVLYGGAPGPVPDVGPGQPGQSSLGYILAHPKEEGPLVSAQSVTNVTTTSAQLHASIDPQGIETQYAFQYMSEAAYVGGGETFTGAAEAPLGGATLNGTGFQSVGVTLSGLSPDTEYRYRAVAVSECAPGKECKAEGPALAFRTYPPKAPGNRAFELVSPADKHGGQVLPAEPGISSCGPLVECKPGVSANHFPMQSTAEGEAVVYEGTSFGPGEGSATENEYKAIRTASGWQSANLTPPLLSPGFNQGYKAFDTDLTRGLLSQFGPALNEEAPEQYQDLYALPASSPLALESLLLEAPPGRPAAGPGAFALNYAGASADLSRVFFEANAALTEETGFAPAAVDGGAAKSNLYEWVPASGQLSLVNVKPGNTETEPGASFGAGSAHAISADGKRAFWSQGTNVYVREDGEETLLLPNPGNADFLAASTDGSKVLLDDGSLYDLGAEVTVDLTGGKGGFQGIAGQGDDLSHVYFVLGPAKGSGDLASGSTTVSEVNATTGAFKVGQAIEGAGVPAGTTIVALGAGTLELSAPATATGKGVPLTAQGLLTGEEENSEGAKAQVGQPNLYAWSEGATAFVATLEAAGSSVWATAPTQRTAQGSPSGRFLAFSSQAILTGYDNVGPFCKVVKNGPPPVLGPGPCTEAFLYDSSTGQLSCASCNPSGSAPLGHAALRRIAGVQASMTPPRYLTDSGRLYFDSQDSLSPADTNDGVEDVYQFVPEGLGDCEREGGCVELISGGREGFDYNLLAIDASGKNVFFTTRSRLVGADKDDLIDLYDAREGGGFPEEPTPLPPEGPLQVPPFESTPSSPTLNDPGNAKPSKACKKGQVKKKGKCVKKHKPKKAGHKKQKRGAK
jgi:hypothetical protein